MAKVLPVSADFSLMVAVTAQKSRAKTSGDDGPSGWIDGDGDVWTAHSGVHELTYSQHDHHPNFVLAADIPHDARTSVELSIDSRGIDSGQSYSSNLCSCGSQIRKCYC